MPTIQNAENFIRGWMIGNFEPSLYRTTDFEMGFITTRKNTKIAPHYQKEATEFNLITSGSVMVNGQRLEKGDVFIYHPLEVCDVYTLTDVDIVCIKFPSVGPDDKVTK